MDALSENNSVSFSKDFQLLTQHLRHPETFDLPAYQVEVALRPYQERGVQWLSMLHHYGFGGILADDMGLGKTIATLALVNSVPYDSAHVEKNRYASKTTLIVVPMSLLTQWKEEFEWT